MAGVAQAVESLGTKVEVRKDWKAVVAEMVQVGWAPKEIVAHLPAKLMREKPSPILEREETVASQWELNHGKLQCGYPQGAGHQHKGEGDDLRKIPVIDPQPYSDLQGTILRVRCG